MRLPKSLSAVLPILFATPALAAWSASGIVIGDSLVTRATPTVSVVSDGAHGAVAYLPNWFRATRVDPQGAFQWNLDPFTAVDLPRPSLYAPNPIVNEADGAGGMWFDGIRRVERRPQIGRAHV